MNDSKANLDEKPDLASPDIIDLVSGKLEELRKRLLDSTRRNPLIHIKFRLTSTSAIRVVDELPEVLRFKLTGGREMRFAPLPSLEEPLRDEETDEFLNALYIARTENEIHLAKLKEIDGDSDTAEEKELVLERELKDRVRMYLGLSPRQTQESFSLTEHAKLHGILPGHILPNPDDVHEDGRHDDNDVQTLLLPDKLGRAARTILEKGRSFERETGVNVLHAVFDLLEWKDPAEQEKFISPLLLLEIRIERRQSLRGAEFFVRGVGEIFVNTNLEEKLRSEHRLALPGYEASGENGGVESYFRSVQKICPNGWQWNVRREVCFGIFPSSKIAMYHDLDPAKRSIAERDTVARLLATTGASDGSYAEIYDPDNPGVMQTVPYLVMDADASQYSALVDVSNGKNIAIEGPPGSGKSQTIVNLIAAGLAEGKKVLFVAEKLTALDVVKNRLEAVGLGNFILPLQAGRGTAEIVYESIENRLGMSPEETKSYADFESLKGVLEKQKVTLQSYLDVLGTHFGMTGMTIYQVIGYAIRTSNVLREMPREIRRISIPQVEELGEHAVEAMVTEAQDFGNRLGQIIGMPALWLAAQKPVTSHNAAEDICDTALTLANKIDNLRQSMSNSIVSILLSKDIFKSDISGVGGVVARLNEHVDQIDVGLIETLVSEQSRRSVYQFCDQIHERQTIIAKLDRVLRDASGWNIEERLVNSRNFADENGKIISPERHRLHHSDLFTEVTLSDRLVEIAGQLPAVWINLERKLSEIRTDALRIASQREAVLDLRIPDLFCRAKSVAVEIEQSLTALSSEIKRIQQILPGADGTHDIAEIRRAADTMERSGLLRFFSNAYKSARNTYIKILGGRHGNTRLEMSHSMQQYAEWLERKCEFEKETRFKEQFGPQFKGIKTEIEDIRSVISFYALTADISAGNIELKSYLETGNLEPILFFARLEEDIPSKTLKEIQAQITELREDITREDALLSESRGHLLVFRDKEEILLDEIEEIIGLKNKEKQLAEKINCSTAADIIGSRFAGIETITDLLIIECEIAETLADLNNTSSAISALRTGELSELQLQFDAFTARRQDIDTLIETLRTDLGLADGFCDASEFAERVDDLRVAAADPHSLLDRARLKRAEDSLCNQGLGEMVDWVITRDNGFDSTELGLIVRAIIAKSMVDAVMVKYEKEVD